MAGDGLFDTSFWVGATTVTFVGLVWWKGGFKALTGALDSKIDKIRASIDESKALREESERLLNDLLKQQREAESIAADIRAKASEEADLVKREAEEAMEAMVRRRTRLAEDKIAQAEAQAVKDVRAAATSIAVEAATQVLAETLAGKGGAGLVDKAIDELDQKLH